MLAILTNQGILPQFFFPEASGRDYALTPYLEHLRDFREQMTVFSGVSHPDVSGGHPADKVFLTSAPRPGASGLRNTVSLDQLMAEQLGAATRFPTLSLQVGVGNFGLSHTRTGVLIPSEKSATNVSLDVTWKTLSLNAACDKRAIRAMAPFGKLGPSLIVFLNQ